MIIAISEAHEQINLLDRRALLLYGNPYTTPMTNMHKPKTLSIVIFGVTGELYKQKLALALWHLFELDLLPVTFKVIGFGRQALDDSELQNLTRNIIKKKEKKYNKTKLKEFLRHFEYVQGNANDRESYKKLKEKMHGNTLFYLAVPPDIAESIVKNVGEISRTPLDTSTKILLEKPFGGSLAKAKQLQAVLKKYFNESQIFRVDHYLAKDTMLQMVPFRFGNRDLEKFWNKKNIREVHVVFYEENKPEDKIGHRGKFYDKLGALKDVGQNHVLQMLAAITMPKPKNLSPKEIQNARAEILRRISLGSLGNKEKIIRGQYEGYTHEPGVLPHSKTETFFRVQLSIKHAAWAGVPIIIESGKALDHEEMSMEVFFKGTTKTLKFFVSGNGTSYDAYERVFHFALEGNQGIFASEREIIAEWQIVEAIIKAWQKRPIIIYRRGTRPEKIKVV